MAPVVNCRILAVWCTHPMSGKADQGSLMKNYIVQFSADALDAMCSAIKMRSCILAIITRNGLKKDELLSVM